MKTKLIQILILSASAVLGLVAAAINASAQPPDQAPLTNFKQLKDGDIVFIESNSERAGAIKKLTESNLTHCGIVFHGKQDTWIVYEGAGRPVGEYSELGVWIGRESGNGEKNPIYVKRLKDREARLSPKIEALRKRAKELHDTPYDFGFAWANKDASGKEYIYCSELVWKAFKEEVDIALRTPHPISDYIKDRPDLSADDVTGLFKKCLNDDPRSRKCRNDKDYDPKELAISPAEVFASTELDPVTDTSQ
jgi:hypothetical protein